MQIPTVPTFTTGESNVTHLTQLSQSVAFVSVISGVPQWRFYKTATLSIPATTWTTVPFGAGGSIGVDTDGVSNEPGGNAVLFTQGYYAIEACVPFQQESSGNTILNVAFLYTAGPNNPYYTSGSTVRFGGNTQAAASGTGTDYVLCAADICPVVCYPGDQIGVQVYVSYATSTDTLTNTSATAGWFQPQFSGRWIRTGS